MFLTNNVNNEHLEFDSNCKNIIAGGKSVVEEGNRLLFHDPFSDVPVTDVGVMGTVVQVTRSKKNAKSLCTLSVEKAENNADLITQEEQKFDVCLIKYLKHIRMSMDDRY